MKQTLPIAVVIPVYNDPDRIRKAIISVINQSISVEEIIIVDDGSQMPLSIDESLHQPNLKIIRKLENSGAAAARNAGIHESSSPYVAFLDADDWWHEEKLERQFLFLRNLESQTSDPLICTCGFIQHGRYAINSHKKNRRLLPLPASSVREFASGCWYAPGTTVLVRRFWIDQLGFFDETLRRYEDYEMFLRWATRGARLAVCPNVLAEITTGKKLLNAQSEFSIDQIIEIYTHKLAACDRVALRYMNAHLCLEKAAAAFNRKEYLPFLTNMLYSYINKPRRTLQVTTHWRRGN